MSRTYRRKTDTYLIREWDLLQDRNWDQVNWRVVYTPVDPKSKEGKRRRAKFHTDKPGFIVNWKGPSWFHNQFAQRPYRRDCKRQIQKQMRFEDYDISILRKPHSPYYY